MKHCQAHVISFVCLLVQLLEACTIKLHLPKAGRLLFDTNGKQLCTEKDIKKEMEVFVSTGEPYRSPDQELQREYTVYNYSSVAIELSLLRFCCSTKR